MHENRLFKIVYYLLVHGKATAPELAERFEVSIRTIYRDINTLGDAGIPIYANQGKGGGIYLLDDFVLDKSIFSESEKAHILAALNGVKSAGGEDLDALLIKLKALFEVNSTNWIEVDFSSWKQNEPKQDRFDLIKRAIFDKNVIVFKYFNRNGEILDRKVKPIQLVFKSKDWYLYGFCLLKNDYRFFKLTRIRQLQILSETFSRDFAPLNIEETIKYTENISIKLKFDKNIAFRVYDEFNDEVIEGEDGSLYVQTDLPNNDILYSTILGFGDDVEVVSPVSVREEIKKKLESMQQKYREIY